MKRFFLVALIFFIFSLNGTAAGVNVAVVAPFSGGLSKFSYQLLNGLELSLYNDVAIDTFDDTKNFVGKLLAFKPAIIVGPFSQNNVDIVVSKFCNKSVVIVLPFAKSVDNCSNVFYYGYDPILATKQLASKVCRMISGNIMVLYAFNRLNKREKDVFVSELNKCGKMPVYVEGIPSFFNLMDDFIRDIFGVRRLKNIEGLTQGRVFSYSLEVNTLVIFAPVRVFAHIVNVLDYYDITPDRILSVDITPDANVMSIHLRMRRRIEFVTPYYMCDSSALAENFLKNYRERFFENPTQVSAVGFDIGNLLDYYLSGEGYIGDIKDWNMLLGRLLFFDSDNRAIINYKTIGFKDIQECRQQILSR